MIRKQLIFGTVILICLSVIRGNSAPRFSSQVDQAAQAKNVVPESSNKTLGMVMKTYTLKHIKPEEFLKAARLLLSDATTYGNTINVLIYEGNVLKFEEMLGKLDIEKKTIQFQVFAIVASREREEDRKMKESREQSAAVALTASLPSSNQKMSPPAKEKYTGELISLNYKETDLRDVVLNLAKFARLNVVFDADVRGIVTCNLQEIPWDQALDIILRQNNMGKTLEGNVLRVAPLRVLSREQNPDKSDVIENKELKRVLDELKALWNFKTYEVDGPSFVNVREDTGPNNFKLVTNRALNLVVSNVKVIGDEPGKRTVSIEQLKLTGMMNFADYVFVDTHDVTLKEKGYLVAGVSGYGPATNALILVISAEIK
jgi:hypothetical protein